MFFVKVQLLNRRHQRFLRNLFPHVHRTSDHLNELALQPLQRSALLSQDIFQLHEGVNLAVAHLLRHFLLVEIPQRFRLHLLLCFTSLLGRFRASDTVDERTEHNFGVDRIDQHFAHDHFASLPKLFRRHLLITDHLPEVRVRLMANIAIDDVVVRDDRHQ